MQYQQPSTPRPGANGSDQQYQNYQQPPSYPPQQGTGYPQWQSPSQPLPPQQQWQQPSQPLPPQQQMQQPPSTPFPLQPGQQQQRPEAPKSPKKRPPYGWIVASLFIGLLIGYAIHAPSSQPAPTTTTPQATVTQDTSQATSQPTKAPVTPTPAHTPKWTTVQTFTGNGAKKTATFTTPNDWKIVWSCAPSSFYGGSYNIIVSVNSTDGSPLDPAAINTICKAGNTGDFTEEHQGGQVYLDINSEGAWTLQVQEFK